MVKQAPNYFISSLAQTLNVGGNDTSIQLSTIYTQDGQVVATSDFSTFGRGVITINPVSISSVEFASFTGITAGTAPAGTLTGTLRGLSFNSNTQIPANQKFNVVGTTVIISFGTHNIQDIIDYINNAVVGGGVPATTNVLGISKLSTSPVSGPSPIVVGDNDYRVGANNFAVSAIGTDSYSITLANAPIAYVKGQQYSFQADVANTGAATLNVNGLGAKTIKKNVTDDLSTGDILVNQIVIVEYDSTNMQLISKTSNGLNPITRTYVSSSSSLGSTTTRFDITNPSGTTFRYTYDGTGTDPVITALTVPIGTQVNIASSSMTSANTGNYIVTNSGNNFFEITNAAGVAENDKTLANGFLKISLAQVWTKPAGLKYIIAEVLGGGGAGGSASSGTGIGGGGGGGGGYSKEILSTSALSATENIIVGIGGTGSGSTNTGSNGATSYFGTTPYLQATGGIIGSTGSKGGDGGTGSNGDLNITGSAGGSANGTSANAFGATGGASFYGGGGAGTTSNGVGSVGGNYGGGGGGARDSVSTGPAGGNGGNGVVIITEYY